MSRTPLILFGGASEERMVSVASAQNLAQHFPEALLWFLAPTGTVQEVSRPELLAHANPFTTPFTALGSPFAGSIGAATGLLSNKTVILALHGTEGEDGTLQTILEKARIPFTGSGSEASRRSFDKKLTKTAARAAHLPVCEDLQVDHPATPSGQAALVEFQQTHPKMVLKPVANGSSVGLFIIQNQADLKSALQKLSTSTAGAYLAEPFLEGREITVGVWDTPQGPRPLPCSEVRVIKGRQFDYEGKYLGKGVQELTPAPLAPEEVTQCQQLALAMHALMGCSGYTRTDMILSERGPVLLEINTLPGLSKASFIPQQLTAAGISLRDFFLAQLKWAETQLANHRPKGIP